MERTQAYRRYQDNKKIQKRKKIVESWYATMPKLKVMNPWLSKKLGLLRKHNLACSCGMCDKNRPQKCKRMPSVKEQNMIKIKNQEMQEQ